jgi:hypothetical protein
VIRNLGNIILRSYGHGEWRVQEILLSVTEKCAEIVTERKNKKNVTYR